MIVEAIAQGLLLGLSTGIFCLFSCAPAFVPFVLSEERKLAGNLSALGKLAAGRLAAYLLFGLAIGLLGDRLAGPWMNKAIGLSLVLLSLGLLAFVATKKWPHLGLCKLSDRFMDYPVVFGFLTGINVCPPFLLAISAALAYGSVTGSVLLFGGFFLGTSVYLAVLVPLGFVARWESFRLIGLITAVLSGILFFLMGLAYLVMP